MPMHDRRKEGTLRNDERCLSVCLSRAPRPKSTTERPLEEAQDWQDGNQSHGLPVNLFKGQTVNGLGHQAEGGVKGIVRAV